MSQDRIDNFTENVARLADAAENIAEQLSRIADRNEGAHVTERRHTEESANGGTAAPTGKSTPSSSKGSAAKGSAAKGSAAKSKPKPEPEPEPEPEESSETEVTRDDVRQALREFRKTHSKEDAIAVLEKHGTKSISAADESVLPALYADFKG